MGIQVLTGTTNGYDYLAGNVGVCKEDTPVCSSSFVETGIAYGNDTSNNWRQYVRYSDSSGTDTLWWDTTNITGLYYYKIQVQYIAGDVDAWVITRAECPDLYYEHCHSAIEVKSVDSYDVGFTAGDSAYAGASGDGGSGDLPLQTQINNLQYKNNSGTWANWDWLTTPPHTVSSSATCYVFGHNWAYQIGVGTDAGC
jgi:hypothetical protein